MCSNRLPQIFYYIMKKIQLIEFYLERKQDQIVTPASAFPAELL